MCFIPFIPSAPNTDKLRSYHFIIFYSKLNSNTTCYCNFIERFIQASELHIHSNEKICIQITRHVCLCTYVCVFVYVCVTVYQTHHTHFLITNAYIFHRGKMLKLKRTIEFVRCAWVRTILYSSTSTYRSHKKKMFGQWFDKIVAWNMRAIYPFAKCILTENVPCEEKRGWKHVYISRMKPMLINAQHRAHIQTEITNSALKRKKNVKSHYNYVSRRYVMIPFNIIGKVMNLTLRFVACGARAFASQICHSRYVWRVACMRDKRR